MIISLHHATVLSMSVIKLVTSHLKLFFLNIFIGGLVPDACRCLGLLWFS